MTETDSVVFLRTLALDKNDVDASDFARIADEIEKLRAALKEIAGREHMLGECWKIAETALGPPPAEETAG